MEFPVFLISMWAAADAAARRFWQHPIMAWPEVHSQAKDLAGLYSLPLAQLWLQLRSWQ